MPELKFYEFKPNAKASIEASKITSFKKEGKEYLFEEMTDEKITALWADKDGKFNPKACSIYQPKAEKTPSPKPDKA